MNGYTTTCCIYNLHHPIEPSKLPFNWIHILDSQIFFDALCICAASTVLKVPGIKCHMFGNIFRCDSISRSQ